MIRLILHNLSRVASMVLVFGVLFGALNYYLSLVPFFRQRPGWLIVIAVIVSLLVMWRFLTFSSPWK